MKKNGVLNRFFMLLVGLFLYAPIFVLIVFSFNATKSRTVWAGFTLDWYGKLFQNTRIMDALTTTLLVSVLAAIIATLLGTMAAIGFFSMKRRPRTLCMTVNNIPMTNADIITGVSLMLLFVFLGKLLGFNQGFGTLLMAHITFDIPYVILSVLPKLRQLDPNIYEAAEDLGASGFYAFRKVILPEIAPGVINGMMIAFTMSIDDFVISYFTAGSQVSTLAMEVYSMARRKVSPEINALSTLMFLTVLTLLVIVNVRQMKQDKTLRRSRAKLTSDLEPTPLLSEEADESDF
ncbi:MAG: ABC transporter permease [Oscillospiraceae bacterium]